MADDDYYEEPQPVPTFSGGSFGKRGDLNKALSSRSVASKQAIASAARAASSMAASLQNLSKSSVKIVNIPKPLQTAQAASIAAAKKREEELSKQRPMPVKFTPPVVQQPVFVPPILAIPENTVTVTKEELEEFKQTVATTLLKKRSMVTTLSPPSPTVKRSMPSIKLRKPDEYSEPNMRDPEKLESLCKTLADILKNPNNNETVINAFITYQDEIRSRSEENYHALAVSMALEQKKNYLSL